MNPRVLVDDEQGLVSRRIFVDDQVYEQEMEKIFARCWLYLGHESQVPNPGDFISTYMGEEPIILVRDKEGEIRAFLNTCRHRGMRVCRLDKGNATAFTCPYHGWTYRNDGKLIGIPRYKDLYAGVLDMEQWGLVPVARIESLRGLVFGTFDASAPTLREYLGEMAWSLEYLADRREGGVEIVGGAHKWVIPTNWKMGAENFATDNYHSEPTHSSAIKAGFLGTNMRGLPAEMLKPLTVSTGRGHGVLLNRPGIVLAPFPELQAYEEEIAREVEERFGPRAQKTVPRVGTVFPNFSFLNFPVSNIRVWHPRGPNKTEVWSWCFVDKKAPPEVKEAVRLHMLRTFSPGGTLDQDDAENWIQCTASSRGPISRNLPFNYQLALGAERFDEELMGWVADGTSESNARFFFRQWADMMSEEE